MTSREVLRLGGERLVRVPPMSVPDRQGDWLLEHLLQYDGVRLFVDRAQAADSSFEFTARTAPIVAEVCARLDGLPLAIELAAAWVRTLSVAQILARLERRLAFLTRGSRDLPARHQALRGAIDWSYGLLEPRAQSVFTRLAIFPAGFSLEAAEAVCLSASTPRPAVVEELGSLIDKSLLRQEAETDEPQFRMLETIREYALERLEHADMEAAQEQLAHYVLELAERAEPELTAGGQVFWLDRLEREHENVRAALHWCATTGAAELSLRLIGALWRFWSTRGYGREGLQWFDGVLGITAASGGAVYAKALNGAGNLARELGDYARAEQLHTESLASWRELGDSYGQADALNNLGLTALYQGDRARAQAQCEQGLHLFRSIEDRGGIAAALNNLGNVARGRRSAALHAESLAIRRELSDKRGIALSLNNLANVLLTQGSVQQAVEMHNESLALRRELRDRAGIVTSLNNLGNAARIQGDVAAAKDYYEEGLALSRELGDKRRVASALITLGALARDKGEWERAATLFHESLVVRREFGDKTGIQAALGILKSIATNARSNFAARVYYEEILGLRKEQGDRPGIAASLAKLGQIARTQGDYTAALKYYEESLGVRRELHDQRAQVAVLNQLGELAFAHGDPQLAREYLNQSVVLASNLGLRSDMASALYWLGYAEETRGNGAVAGSRYLESLTIYQALGDLRHARACEERLAELAKQPAQHAEVDG